ncbi:MAG: DUF294 nucleotidyltransferase-like domain-containing protein [Desulfuromonadales bacterium]|nr:DUF294 nucleotidyltransferase-like domain-containing protein [Desulfuromonadales bacterium]
MSGNNFCEESFFFLHIDSICRSPAVTCAPDANIVHAARLMHQQNITGLVVTEGETPVGILSVRDLRDLIATGTRDLSSYIVGEIMHVGVITVRQDAYVFEAIFKMAKHNIHRLAVVDKEQKLIGVINDTDLLSLQTRSPLYLTQEIEITDSVEGLRDINGHILDMVHCAMQSGADTRSLVQLITHFNDAFTQRIIALMEQEDGIRLPPNAAYLALGSEGRGEQTLRTDQDSALVYADDISEKDLAACVLFSEKLVDTLEFVGVPRCPGNTMASNPQWRHSLSEWTQKVESWINTPVSENMVNFGMFQDFRTIHGNTELEMALHESIYQAAQRNNLLFPYVAKNVVRFPAPIGMFGRIKTERSGENRGKLDLKKGGIFAITSGVSLLALEQNIHQGTTWDKIEQLSKEGVLSDKNAEAISEAFSILLHYRLKQQLSNLTAGKKPSNCIDPMRMPERDRNQLRKALRGVNQLLRFIREHYRLDFISR